MVKLIKSDLRYLKLIFVLSLFLLFVFVLSFLNYQKDDEIYIGAFEYTSYPEDADLSDGVITVNENTKGITEGRTIAEIAPIHVDAGAFVLDTDHQNDDDIEAIIYDGDQIIDQYHLESESLNTRHQFVSEKDLYNMRVEYKYFGEGRATIKRSILYSENGPFYYDTVFFAVLISIFIIVVVLSMIKQDFFNQSFRDKACFIAIVSFLIMINYMSYRPFSNYSADMAYHLSRIEHTYLELIRGEQFPIVLYSDALRGAGEIMILYPYLLLIVPAVTRIMGVSPDGAIRFFFIIVNTSTCLVSYYTAKRITANKYLSTFFMMMYGMLTYRLTTMTYRWAYGEFQAFIFIPLVILGVYEVIVNEKKNWPILVVGMTGLIQCHTISTIQAVIICFFVGVLFCGRLMKEWRFVQIFLAIVSTCLVNLWYIIPFLTYYKSDIDVEGHLQTGDMSGITFFIADWLRFLPNTVSGEQQHHQIGIIGGGLILFVGLAFYFVLACNRITLEDRFGIILMIVGGAYLLLASKVFPWQTLQKFELIDHNIGNLQFMTRFYLGGECSLIFGSLIVISQRELSGLRYKSILIMILSLTIVQGYFITDSFMSRMDPFLDSRICRYKADIPNMLYASFVPEGYWGGEDFPTGPESDKAIISDYKHEGIHTSFEYTTNEATAVDLPLMYYIGYEASLSDGTHLDIEKGRGGCLRITLPISKNESRVYLDFEGFGSWRIATVISIVCSLTLIGYLIFRDGRMPKWYLRYNQHLQE